MIMADDDGVPGEVERAGVGKSETTRRKSPASRFEPNRRELFLIEFLIDTVELSPNMIPPEILQQQTCVKVKFLHFPPMDVCEKDLRPNKEVGGDVIRFNSGKSLMFALPQQHFENPPPICVEFNVYKCAPTGTLPEELLIGSIKVCLSTLFRQIFEEVQKRPDRLPVSKSIKDVYMLTGPGRLSVGEVRIYIRVSCLGSNVITEFQCGKDMSEEPVLFKNKEGKKVFELKPIESKSPQTTYEYEGTGAIFPGQSQAPSVSTGPIFPKIPPQNGNVEAFQEGNKIIFQMPSRADRCSGDHNVVEYKVSNQNETYKVTPGSLIDPSRTKDGVTVAQLNTDPSKNVFVLRVGDKTKKCDKPKMMLELRTPKQKIDPVVLPPYHEDIAIQTESEKKKKKGKGKRGKK